MKYKKAYFVSKFDPVSKAFDRVLRGTVAIVMDGQKYVGIIDDRNANINVPLTTKCGTIAIKAPKIKERDNILTVINKFLAGHFRALPYQKEDEIVGIVDRITVLREIRSKKLIENVRLEEIVENKVYTIDIDETLAKAKSLMKAKDVHKLIVTERGKPVGVISTFDFLTLVKPRKRDKAMLIDSVKSTEKTKRVKDLYREVKSISITKTLYDLIDFMIENKESSALITKSRKPVGVLTAMDIFKFISIKSEDVDIVISGLKEDIYFEPSLRKGVLRALSRFKKDVSAVRIRVKKGKSVVELKAKLYIGNKVYNLSSSDYDLGLSAQKLFNEIKDLLRKLKDKKKSENYERTNKH